MPRPLLVTVVTVGLLATACTGTSDAEPDVADPAPASDATTIEADPVEPPADATPPDTTPRTTSATTPTTSTTTTTTLPPPPVAALTFGVLPSNAREVSFDSVQEIAVLDDDQPRVVMTGQRTAAASEQPHAVVYLFDEKRAIDHVTLPAGDALQSATYDISGFADLLIVAGVVVDADGFPQAAIWRSDDRGSTWSDVDTPLANTASMGVAAANIDGSIAMLARVDTPRGYEMVIARETDDGWDVAPFGVDHDFISIGRMFVDGDTVIVTGSFDAGERTAGAVWTSIDGGATYTAAVDAVISDSSAIGDPALGGDGYVAMSSRPDNQPASIVTSTDGITWRRIDLSLVNEFGEPEGLIGSGAARIIEDDGRLIFGYSDVRASIGIAGIDGVGTVHRTLDDKREIYGPPMPFALDGVLHTVANSHSSFRVSRSSGGVDLWAESGKPDGGLFGPVPTGVALFDSGDTIRAISNAYPDVRPSDGGIQYGPAPLWTTEDGSSWTDDPTLDDDVRLVGSNGAASVAFSSVDDPGDDDIDGPLGGMAVAYQLPDGTWTTPELLLTGPGGDSANDVAALSDGLVMVGDRSNRDEAGAASNSIILMEYENGGAWTDRAVDVVTAERSTLHSVTATGNDVALARGWQLIDSIWKPLLLARSSDGTWTETTLPTDLADVDVFDAVANDGTLAVLTRENDDTWILYTSADALTFDRTPITFDDELTAQPSWLAQVEGRTYLVGNTTRVGVSAGIALWIVSDDGSTSSIDVEGGPTGLQFDMDDVLVSNGTLLVGGDHLKQNTVWTMTLPAD